MKGQILVVTRVDPTVSRQIEGYLNDESLDGIPSGDGWIGRLAGSIVSVAVTIEENDRLILSFLHVANDLRLKNVGRYMIREIRRLGTTGNDSAELHVSEACFRHPFTQSIESELERKEP